MDLALAIEALIPGAQYSGSVTANDQAAYESMQWEDERAKPLWSDVLAADSEASAQVEREKVNAAARAYLASTDWYIIRQGETGAEVPADILEARQAARDSIV